MNKVIHNNNFFLVVLSSLTIYTGILLSSTFVSADDVIDEINITVPVSCTLSGTGMTSHNANISNGTYQANIGTTTLKALCNDSEGFAIYATGYTGDTIGETNSNKLVGASTNTTIETGTATTTGNPDVSNWAMKLNTTTSPTPAYPITIDNSFNDYHAVPNTYTKVAHRDSSTDIGTSATGAELTTTYAAYISKTQPADTYTGQVIYTLVHPSDAGAPPPQPQQATAGCINYFANARNTEGTMGCQSVSRDGATIKLFASNFSREGYGFAGWSDAYDYTTNPDASFYGPNEDIVVPTGTKANGLSLYAVWIKAAGTMQANAQSICNNLTRATYNNEGDSDESTWSITANLSSISALTDNRDGQTYAVAKLSDNNCWMIENLRLDNTSELSSSNTNNPSLPLINVYDISSISNRLSPTSNIAYDASTAPEGWCTTNSAACDDQSRLRTDNTANRITFATTSTSMSSHNASFYSYGNYYNWYSATAGRGTYNSGYGDIASGDICPTGWHLPTGIGSSEFGLLSNSLGGYKNASDVAQLMNSTTSPTVTIMLKRLRHFPNNLLYSGYVNGDSIMTRGSIGSLWSSTANNNSIAFYLSFDFSRVYPGTCSGYFKNYGRAVRCVASN